LKEQFVTVHIMQHLRQTGSDETNLDPEMYCERGLENYESKELRNGIDTTRKLQKLLVIHEQARQSLLGMKDEERIRLMATELSERSNVKAQLRGALDQYEVETTVKANGFVSPLEAHLAEQQKKMMKEVIGELHKEQQGLYSGQQQHQSDPTSQQPHQELYQQPDAQYVRQKHDAHIENGHFSGMPLVDFRGQAVEDMSTVNLDQHNPMGINLNTTLLPSLAHDMNESEETRSNRIYSTGHMQEQHHQEQQVQAPAPDVTIAWNANGFLNRAGGAA
jgi:hypothetical protein